ncbi:hypothetical protein VTO58DRAFT_103571 [Aureobasidium pullulans]
MPIALDACMQFVFQYNITFAPLHDEQYSHCERFARNEGLSVVDIYNDLMSLTAIAHPTLFENNVEGHY